MPKTVLENEFEKLNIPKLIISIYPRMNANVNVFCSYDNHA